MTDHRMSRRGFSLLEMVASISCLLLLAVTASSMLGSVTDIGLSHRHARQEGAAVRRFAETFRSDLGDARRVAAQNDQWPIEITREDRIVEYRWDPKASRLIRLVRSDSDRDESAEILEMDVYPLTDRCRPRLVVAQDRVRVILREGDAAPAWIVEAPR